MAAKLTTEEFIKRANKVHDNEYDYSKVEYKGAFKKVIIICRKHGGFKQISHNHLNGAGCPDCCKSTKLTTKTFIKKAKEKHGSKKYDYNKVNYVTSHIKVTLICNNCGQEFLQEPNSHLNGSGCPDCSVYKNDKYSTKEFITQSQEKHGNKYDYSKTKYINAKTQIKIICKKHGEFLQIPYTHLRGGGCAECAGKKQLTTKDFIKRANKIHGKGIYDYSKVEYKYGKSKVIVICKKHGEFLQSAGSHLAGRGCPKCIGRHKTTEEFIKEARDIHGNTYDYAKTKYTNCKTQVIIICKKHGEFLQIPYRHSEGHGCPLCNVGWTVDFVRSFLKELINNIPTMTQIEWYHILKSTGILDIADCAKSSPFVPFLLQKDKLDINELQKFVDNQPSIYEDLIDTNDTTILEDKENQNIEDLINKEENTELQNLNVRDTFQILDKISEMPSIDEETIEALIGESLWKMIQIICEDESKIKEIKKKKSKKYSIESQKRFLDLYTEASNYNLPKDYNFRIDNQLVKPNLMQRLTIALLRDKKNLLNLSGTGAGKTLSALLFARYIKSNLTIIVCPNDVLEVWERTLKGVDPTANVFINNFSPKIIKNKSNYVIFNIEKFQQRNSEEQIKKLLKNKVDFIILDEIQFMKDRAGTDRSQRNINIHKLVSNSRKNDNLHVLGMTATPVINELSEGVSLLELVSGQQYNEISNQTNLGNCIALRGHFVSMGIRWMPQYKQKLNIKTINVDCSDKLVDVKKIKRNPLLMERLFIEEKINSIASEIKKGCVIYTQYKVIEIIRKKVKELGFSCSPYTGDQNSFLRKEILKSFVNKEIDVLIATSPISTGVDGLQHVCNDLFVVSLPWTSAMFQQLIGRFWRQGQKKKQVNVTIPLSYLNVISKNGEEKEWSWCKYRYSIVKSKKSLSDVAVDGVIPEQHHINQAKALKASYDWLQRIEEGNINIFKRRKISVSLSDGTMIKRQKEYGDFTTLNKKLCISKSSTIHESWQLDPSEYETYHNQYKQARKDWNYDHINEIVLPYVNGLPDDFIIGDFGSGPQAEISNSTDKEVMSFDHIESDEVISCDLANMPIEYYNSLDVVVFSLSLMGNNLTDYIREAYKCLKKNGQLFIVELSSRVSSKEELKNNIEMLGFKNIEIELVNRFIIINAEKNSKIPDKNIKLKLGRIKT